MAFPAMSGSRQSTGTSRTLIRLHSSLRRSPRVSLLQYRLHRPKGVRCCRFHAQHAVWPSAGGVKPRRAGQGHLLRGRQPALGSDEEAHRPLARGPGARAGISPSTGFSWKRSAVPQSGAAPMEANGRGPSISGGTGVPLCCSASRATSRSRAHPAVVLPAARYDVWLTRRTIRATPGSVAWRTMQIDFPALLASTAGASVGHGDGRRGAGAVGTGATSTSHSCG